MKLQLKKFDVREMSKDSVVLCIGRRGSGKSYLTKELSYHLLGDFPVGVVISASERANRFYQDFVPNMLIYDEYKPEVLQRFVERQQKVNDQYMHEKERFKSSDIDPRAFLIMDDCLYDNSWIADKNIRYIFLNGRHVKCFYLLTVQFPLGIPPHLRTNVDYVFLYRDNYISNRRRLYEHYAGMFDSFEVFCTVMDNCTENYECLVINNKVKSNKISDQVFWYKASECPDFRICNQQFWDMQSLDNERRLRSGLPKEDYCDEYDPRALAAKKKMQLQVKKI